MEEYARAWSYNLQFLDQPIPEQVVVEMLIQHFNPAIKRDLLLAEVARYEQLYLKLRLLDRCQSLENNVERRDQGPSSPNQNDRGPSNSGGQNQSANSNQQSSNYNYSNRNEDRDNRNDNNRNYNNNNNTRWRDQNNRNRDNFQYSRYNGNRNQQAQDQASATPGPSQNGADGPQSKGAAPKGTVSVNFLEVGRDSNPTTPTETSSAVTGVSAGPPSHLIQPLN